MANIPRQHILFHSKDRTTWHAYPPTYHGPNCITFLTNASLAMQPTNTVPVTVTQMTQHIHVQLPIPGLVQPIPVPFNNLLILQHLTTPSTTWEEPLWHEIQPHAHIDTLQAQLLNVTHITIVSDAAVHANSHGTCSWVIWANSELWTGEGFVPGHPQDMYSGLAEAYGIYTALSFLHQYCTYFPLIHRPHCTVHVYCDNQGILNCATRKSIVPYP